MGQILVLIGAVVTGMGLLLIALEKFGLPRLPGDIFIQKGNFTLYFPIMTMLVLSIVLTIIVNLFRK